MLALLVALPVGAATAQESSFILAEPGEVSMAGSTYAELVAMAMPGAVETDGRLVVDSDVTVPHIEGADFTLTTIGPVVVNSIEALAAYMDGRPHLALVIELAQSGDGFGPVAALAVYDIVDEPVLVDLKDIAFDRMSGFGHPAKLTVGQGHDLLLVHNSHGNSNQFYDATSIIDLVDGELTLVDMVMTLSDQVCAGTRTQYLQFSAAAPTAAERGDFQVSVIDRSEPPTETCEETAPYRADETAYVVNYSWNDQAGSYGPEGEGWAALEEVNAERY
jgi:hypothetical protein